MRMPKSGIETDYFRQPRSKCMSVLRGNSVTTVTEYLERARESAALADRANATDKKKILAIADAWLKLADDVAKEAGKSNGSGSTK